MKPTVETKEQYLQFVKEWKTAINVLTQKIRYWRYDTAEGPTKEAYDNARKAVLDASKHLGTDGSFVEERKGGTYYNYVTQFSTDSQMVHWLLTIRRIYKVKAEEARKALQNTQTS